MNQIARLAGRGAVEVTGDDRVSFLQGLVSNDVTEAVPGQAVWAALLTPQGKYLSDFFIHATPDSLLLDVARGQAESLIGRLGRFRLRAKAVLRDVSGEWSVYAAWPDLPALPEGSVAARDPRLDQAGWRILARVDLPVTADEAAWQAHRLALGLPDPADLETEKSVLLEAGFDELHGISWSKGCYMGQELTARTKYRGLMKRRLVPVSVEGALPPPGTPVLWNGAEIGTMRSGQGRHGLAQLRLEAIAAAALTCGEAVLTPHLPAWMNLPETAS